MRCIERAVKPPLWLGRKYSPAFYRTEKACPPSLGWVNGIVNLRSRLFTGLLLVCCFQGWSSTNVTITVAGSQGAGYTVATGDVARVTYVGFSTGYKFPGSISVGVNAAGVTHQQTNDTVSVLPTVVGPASISLFAGLNPGTPPNYGSAICTINVTSPADSFVPSSTVVIPADAGGPVSIILESSTDLITWTPALPGTYGTSTTNRFFRVRAQRTGP